MSGLTPAEWLLLRADWLLDVHPQPNPLGGWDVVVHFDGSYALLEDAQRVAAVHREEIEAMLRRARDGEPDAA